MCLCGFLWVGFQLGWQRRRPAAAPGMASCFPQPWLRRILEAGVARPVLFPLSSSSLSLDLLPPLKSSVHSEPAFPSGLPASLPTGFLTAHCCCHCHHRHRRGPGQVPGAGAFSFSLSDLPFQMSPRSREEPSIPGRPPERPCDPCVSTETQSRRQNPCRVSFSVGKLPGRCVSPGSDSNPRLPCAFVLTSRVAFPLPKAQALRTFCFHARVACEKRREMQRSLEAEANRNKGDFPA